MSSQTSTSLLFSSHHYYLLLLLLLLQQQLLLLLSHCYDACSVCLPRLCCWYVTLTVLRFSHLTNARFPLISSFLQVSAPVLLVLFALSIHRKVDAHIQSPLPRRATSSAALSTRPSPRARRTARMGRTISPSFLPGAMCRARPTNRSLAPAPVTPLTLFALKLAM